MSLASEDERTVQFALDSLRLIRDEALATLVCYLDDPDAVRVREVYWLNRAPHFELFAHYAPKKVGDAVAIVLGPPPNQTGTCSGLANGGSLRDRELCAAAWRAHMRRPPAKQD